MKPGNLQFYARCQYQKTLKRVGMIREKVFLEVHIRSPGLCVLAFLGEAFYPPR